MFLTTIVSKKITSKYNISLNFMFEYSINTLYNSIKQPRYYYKYDCYRI